MMQAHAEHEDIARSSPPSYPPQARRAIIDSPVGNLQLVVNAADALLSIVFEGREDLSAVALATQTSATLDRVRQQLAEYFSGDRQVFEDIPLAPAGTPFQRRVWDMLLQIPYGETWSYGALGEALTPRSHARPVGGANGRNPIPIIIPCHRVIGAQGQLTGFGGGLPRKQWLLAHEGVDLADAQDAQSQLAIF